MRRSLTPVGCRRSLGRLAALWSRCLSAWTDDSPRAYRELPVGASGRPTRARLPGARTVRSPSLYHTRLGGLTCIAADTASTAPSVCDGSRNGRSQYEAIARWRVSQAHRGWIIGISTAVRPSAINSKRPACLAVRSSSRNCARRAIPACCARIVATAWTPGGWPQPSGPRRFVDSGIRKAIGVRVVGAADMLEGDAADFVGQ